MSTRRKEIIELSRLCSSGADFNEKSYTDGLNVLAEVMSEEKVKLRFRSGGDSVTSRTRLTLVKQLHYFLGEVIKEMEGETS